MIFMVFRKSVYPLFISFLFAINSGCSATDDPKLAFQQGDYKRSFELWKPIAMQGDPEAENYLGVHYYAGLGVKRDHLKAIKWYSSAAEKGYPSAQRHLGDMYYGGHGIQRDFYKAFIWYFAASQQGNENAKRKLDSITGENKLTPNQQMHAKIEANKFITDIKNQFISHDTYIEDK